MKTIQTERPAPWDVPAAKEEATAPKTGEVVSLADNYADTLTEIAKIEQELKEALLPYEAKIAEIRREADYMTDAIRDRLADALTRRGLLEKTFTEASQGEKERIFPGKRHQVRIKRTYTRSVDTDRLHSLLDREGLLSHYVYLFKTSVKVADLDAAMRTPIFPAEAKDCVSSRERSVKVEVV